ncbi:group II intron reverse transcriptase/maturase [Mucilaginibacter sp. UC70_90]
MQKKKKKSGMLEQVLDRRNIEKALEQVIRNKGSAGVDGMETDELRAYLNSRWQSLRTKILEGSYEPAAVRKVEIPKAGGGKRMLGIPTVLDRLLQQAISQWLSPKYEEQFSENSYGFRPGKNAHQAVMQAQRYVNEDKVWVVELDLEKFFDKVNHDRLMSTLSRTIRDKPTLKLIRSYLRSGILEDGVVNGRTEGTPQGSPLSPLLSNIVLNDLDKELEKRGHSYVRYADDCSIYVKSEAAAKRLAEGIMVYIEGKLLLKVNREKTKISRPNESKLLGFTFVQIKGGWEIWIAKTSVGRIMQKCKSITGRSNGLSEQDRLVKLQTVINGWVNYFVISKARNVMRDLDSYVRRRLRMCLWKSWKRAVRRAKELMKLGISRHWAYKWGSSSKGCWRVAHSQILRNSLTNIVFERRGYIGFAKTYHRKTAAQLSLF